MLGRIFRNALQGILRHGGLSLISVAVITLTFGTTSTLSLFAFGAGSIIDYYESRALVTAFFKDTASEEQILAIKGELEAREGVIEVVYTSKDEAFVLYSERFKDLVNVARAALLSLVLVFSAISTAVVLITIGLIIHSMEEEIEIMGILGANSQYIKWPFIVQGGIYGLVAALVSGGILTLAIPLVFPYIRGFFSNVPLPNPSILFQTGLFAAEATAGILIGALGSWLAANRYLKV